MRHSSRRHRGRTTAAAPTFGLRRARSAGVMRALARAPIAVYDAGCGSVFRQRMLMLMLTGRKSGLSRFVVLEVVRRPADGRYIVAAGMGEML